VVAHNAEFDAAFLRKAAKSYGVDLPIGQPLCTLKLSRRLDPDRQRSHRLADVCARYGVELLRPHDALADADATAAVLPHLLRAHGITTVAQLGVAS
jgi:DNA polymerase III subunit epsilon